MDKIGRTLLRPSSAYRWLNCTQSINNHKSFGTIAGQVGSIMHELAEGWINIILNDNSQSAYDDYRCELLSNLKDSGFHDVINYFEHIELYCSYLRVLSRFDNAIIHIEKGFDILESNSYFITGTVDSCCYRNGILEIIDLKTGKAEIELLGNEQLYLYALGYYNNLRHDKIRKKDVKVIFITVFQQGRVKSIRISVKELKLFEKRVKDILGKLENNDYAYQPSDKVCSFCSYKKECESYQTMRSVLKEEKRIRKLQDKHKAKGGDNVLTLL